MLGIVLIPFSVFGRTTKLFHSISAILHPIGSVQRFRLLLLYIMNNACYFKFLSYQTYYLIVVLTFISLMADDIGLLLYVLVGYLCDISGEVSIQIFCPFYNQVWASRGHKCFLPSLTLSSIPRMYIVESKNQLVS